jgi:hypothetical protein
LYFDEKKLTLNPNTKKMRHLRYLLLLLTVCISALHAQKASDTRVSLLFRMDKVELKPDSIQEAIFALFEQNHIPLTVACIPFAQDNKPNFPLSPDYRRFVRNKVQQHLLELAVMGYKYDSCENNASSLYFLSSPYEEILENVHKGKLLIEAAFGVPVAFFVPPCKDYNTHVLKAIKKAGYIGISTPLSNSLSSRNGLAYLPQTVGTFHNYAPLLDAIGSERGVCIFQFTAASLMDSGFGLDSLNQMLQYITQKGYCTYTFSDYLAISPVYPGRFRLETNRMLLRAKWPFSGIAHNPAVLQERNIRFQLLYLFFASCLSFVFIGLFIAFPRLLASILGK